MGGVIKSEDRHHGRANGSSAYEDNDIAVVGMSVNVAGAEDVGQFWNLMMQAESQHVEVPAHRFTFKSTAWRPVDPERKWYGNFINDYDAFDHKFFKKSPREALFADPQQRLFLQCAYQAVEQSGYFNLAKPDKMVGVYVGVGSAEYEANFACHQTNAFSATGNLKSAIAGRVSHFFGWTGPGLAVDTACSASAVAMHLACRAIASGECTAALVGGTQMLTSPFHFQNLAGASFLSPSGPCKPFDIRADGYCRGEGIGAVFIKRMSDALRDGDSIFGCIASTAVLQNDSSTPMFVPNADSLASLFETVIRSARLSPADITAVEAHGTGTRVGDPAEFESIRRILGGSPSRIDPLPVCSVKSLVGHTECASGLISLVKVLLMLHHNVIPMQVGFKELNPELKHSKQDMIEIPRNHRAWQPGFKAALINSFGASGSNSAMVVTKISPKESHNSEIVGKCPFWITGADERSLIAYAAKLADFVEASEASIADIAYNISKQSNRTLPKSIVFQVGGKSELVARFREFVKSREAFEIRSVPEPRPVILCFGGQTSKIVGLSRQLFDQLPLLRKHLDDCELIISRHGFGSLYPAIFQKEPLHDTVQLQIALFALQYACARVWIDCGVQVAAVVGHSFGELACLTISGSASLEHTIIAVHKRATLVRDYFGPDPGAMMAIEGDIHHVKRLLQASIDMVSSSDSVAEIACYNGPTSFTLAGSSLAIDAVEAVLPQFKALRTKKLSVSNAFHSCLVNPLMAGLRQISEGMVFQNPEIPWERALEQIDESQIPRDFFATHMRQPVYAHNAFERLNARFPAAIWLEAGSGSTITRMAKKALGAPATSHFQSVNICNHQNAISDMTDVVENLWKEGVNTTYWLHHSSKRQHFQHLLLPPYQFEKTRHWLELKDPDTVLAPSMFQEAVHHMESNKGLCSFAGYLDSDRRSACYQLNTATESFKEALLGRKVVADCKPRCSTTLAVAVAIEVHREFLPEIDWLKVEHEARNVTSHTPLTLSEARKAWITIQPIHLSCTDAWKWVIYSTDHLDNGRIVHFEGELLPTTAHELTTYQRIVQQQTYHDLITRDDADDAIHGRNIYKVFDDLVQYSEPYRGLEKLTRKAQRAAGRVRMRHTSSWTSNPYLSDCFIQVSKFWLQCNDDHSAPAIYTVTGLDRWIHMPVASFTKPEITSTIYIREVYATHMCLSDGLYLADIFVFDHEKKLVDSMIGVRFERSKGNESLPLKMTVRSDVHVAPHLSTNGDHNLVTSKASEYNVAMQKQYFPTLISPEKYTTSTLIHKRSHDSTSSGRLQDEGIPTPLTGGHHDAEVVTADSVVQVLSNLSGVDVEDIDQETELADIGIDSLVEIELLTDLRKRFGVNLMKTQGWYKVITVADLVRYIEPAVMSV